jgi:hypothetical protein
VELPLSHPVAHPTKAHVHCFGSFLLDGVVSDAGGCVGAGPLEAPTAVNSCKPVRKKAKNLPKTSRIELAFEPNVPWGLAVRTMSLAGHRKTLADRSTGHSAQRSP